MKFHPFDNKAKLLEERNISLSETLILLEQYLARSNEVFENGSIAMEQTCFCISRNKNDYLQVSCDGPDVVWFYSDRLHFEMNFILRIFCSKSIMAFGGSREIGKKIISDYFELTRECFEAKYEEGYRNPQQFGYETIT